MSGMRVSMVVAERSGDQLAALLLGGMKQAWPDLSASGIGGPQMEALGFASRWSCDELSVRGLVEALMRYRRITGIRQQLIDDLLQNPPDLFVGVDASDFNLTVERALNQRGIPAIQLVCPSIWAWRMDRVEKLQRSCDHVLCIFPFEPALLAQHGIPATYVGHPLANVIPQVPDKAAARLALGLGEGDEVLAVLPGSRSSEVKYLADVFFQAARRVQQARPGLKLVVPAIPALRSAIEAAARRAGLSRDLVILDGQSHAALAACDLTLIASGTATLEAALFKRPMVIAYRMNALSWQIMKRQSLQPWVGLPNILLREMAVPELLQQAASPEGLAREVLAWLDSPARMAAVQQKFDALHHELRRDTATLASDAIAHVLS